MDQEKVKLRQGLEALAGQIVTTTGTVSGTVVALAALSARVDALEAAAAAKAAKSTFFAKADAKAEKK